MWRIIGIELNIVTTFSPDSESVRTLDLYKHFNSTSISAVSSQLRVRYLYFRSFKNILLVAGMRCLICWNILYLETHLVTTSLASCCLGIFKCFSIFFRFVQYGCELWNSYTVFRKWAKSFVISSFSRPFWWSRYVACVPDMEPSLHLQHLENLQNVFFLWLIVYSIF